MDQNFEQDVEVNITEEFELQSELELPMDAALENLLPINEVEIQVVEDMLAAEVESPIVSDEVLAFARTGLNMDTLCGAIETIIFMSDKPVSILKIKALIDDEMPLKVIHEAILRLQAEYEEKHHGLRLLEVAEGYQYRTKATYSKFVQDIFKINSIVLSPTALEVLAILAYKQPVSKVEVDKIRGVDSGHIVRALMDKRLVKVMGRSEEVGRPVLYGTTPEFLEVFNLADLSQLPPEHELEALSKVSSVGKITDIKTLVQDGDKARFKFDEIEELDQLSEAIKNISSDTDFTNSLKVEEKKRMNTEGVEIKSAFDLLEEFVNKKLISDENKKAFESNLTTNIIDPKVINDLEAGPFNAPIEIDEDDFFQMIDLDTGLPLDDVVSEEEELTKALDDAFANLTGETESQSLEELDFGSELEEKDQKIEEVTSEMIAKAQDLDLDLSFLNET